jgi:hypothetical protein
MSRYSFSAEGPFGRIEGNEEEFPDDLTAHRHAQVVAREASGGMLDGKTLVVRRENGDVVSEVPIGGTPLS